ncbi:MAG: ABC transporter permease [Deltaproteobacteria bacterium]|nr:ABC transporter permease [Deltaproteobacteria bacterium]
MAWRNVWRNPRRSVLTMLAIAFACMLLVFMLSFQLGSYEQMIEFTLRLRTGHLQVQAKGYENSRNIRLAVKDPAAVKRILQDNPSVAAVAMRGNGFALLSSETRSYGALVTGVQPGPEAAITNIRAVVREGEYLSPGDNNTVLLGSLLADNLKLSPGGEMVLLGQAKDGSVAASVLTVAGTFSTGADEMDRQFALMPLSTFDRLFAMRGAVHEVVATCKSLDDVDAVQAAVADAVSGLQKDPPLVVWNWRELLPGLLQGIKIDFFSGVIFYFILIVVVAFSIMNTFLMAVFERTKEFGVLMALGVSRWRLSRLLLLESSFLCLVGIAAGVAAGVLLTLYFQNHGIHIASVEDLLRSYGLPPQLYPRLSKASLIPGPVLVFAITFLTALYPALRVRLLKTVDALRS